MAALRVCTCSGQVHLFRLRTSALPRALSWRSFRSRPQLQAQAAGPSCRPETHPPHPSHAALPSSFTPFPPLNGRTTCALAQAKNELSAARSELEAMSQQALDLRKVINETRMSLTQLEVRSRGAAWRFYVFPAVAVVLSLFLFGGGRRGSAAAWRADAAWWLVAAAVGDGGVGGQGGTGVVGRWAALVCLTVVAVVVASEGKDTQMGRIGDSHVESGTVAWIGDSCMDRG
eukprot:96806-Chlamydomonas_euryale.AAC.1